MFWMQICPHDGIKGIAVAVDDDELAVLVLAVLVVEDALVVLTLVVDVVLVVFGKEVDDVDDNVFVNEDVFVLTELHCPH